MRKKVTKSRTPMPPRGRRLLIVIGCLVIVFIALGLVLAGLTPTLI